MDQNIDLELHKLQLITNAVVLGYIVAIILAVGFGVAALWYFHRKS